MKYLIIVASLLAANIAAAAPIQVQTGWHANFTRVVLIVPTQSAWTLGRNEDGYVLKLSVTEGFNLSRFFDLIPGERINRVSQDAQNGELFLSVACDCHIKAAQDSPSVLVLDIVEGPPSNDSPYELAIDNVDQEATMALDPLAVPSVQTPYAVPRDRLFPLTNAAPLDAQSPPSDTTEMSSTKVATNATKPDNVTGISAQTIENLNSLESSIVESLGRALSQGLLDTNVNGRDDRSLSTSSLRPDEEITLGIHTITGIDRAAIPDDPSLPVSQSGTECIPQRFFALPTWGDERPFQAQIAEKRGGVITASGELDESAITLLAQNYLFFGFGREAVQTLAMDGLMSPERRILKTLAQIIDNDLFDFEIFAQQISCDSAVALWALLAAPEGGLDAEINRPAVLREFKLLPQALQLHLSARLAQKFVASGDNDSALEILKSVETLPDKTLDVDLAVNVLTRALGEQQDSIDQIVEIAEADTRVTPEVMITLFEDAIENDSFISDDDLLLADALRFENASLPAASDLAIAQIKAYLQNSQFREANSLMLEASSEIDKKTALALKNLFASKAVVKMQDHSFLAFALNADYDELSSPNRNMMARRVLDLGFSDPVFDILKQDSDGLEGQERQYLLAEAALAAGELEKVFSLLQTDQADRASSLKQIATDFSSQDGISPLAYVGSDDNIDQWRRGEWEALQSANDPLLQAASNAVLQPVSANIGSATPIADSRALLSETTETRSVIDNLLDRFTTPEMN